MAVLFVFLLLLYDFLTERTDEIDRRREKTAPSQASNGGNAGAGSREGAKSPDAAIDPGGCDFGEGLYNEEAGTSSLELAYALTVHKAQGSQFDTVILVISEPCLLLSRELLYTALTRQVKRIVILYNEQPYHLRKYASCEFSDIARRFTDLFADVFHDGDQDMRPQIVQVRNKFYEDRLIHRTARGELVRSKSEVIIANALFYHHLDYSYERELVLGEHVKFPDFRVIDEDTGDEWFWEHCGMMEDPRYRKRWEDKKAFYKKNGIEEGRNLIVTYDINGAIDSQIVESYSFGNSDNEGCRD